MKWKTEQVKHVKSVEGDRRIHPCGFLWFPMTIGGETRWLERAKIRQVAKINLLEMSGWIGMK